MISAIWQFEKSISPIIQNSLVILSESVGANATKDESKDPEDASSAMPRQGILPKLLSSFLIYGKQNDLREKEFRENSLKIVL